jgi:hypothetical protein
MKLQHLKGGASNAQRYKRWKKRITQVNLTYDMEKQITKIISRTKLSGGRQFLVGRGILA